MEAIRVVDCYELPEKPQYGNVYRLLPNNPNDAYYVERTDRNIGWIARGEQAMLRNVVIGIAGCGGMGAQAAEKFLRLGVGEIRIADRDHFDISNINRQFGATRHNVGKPKAFETARLLRAITDDSTVVVYPQGIARMTADAFVAGCDVICDEIEFWCVGARIALHEAARRAKIPVFVCNSIGFGSHLFLFTPTGTTMEDCLGLSYDRAIHLEKKILDRIARPSDIAFVMEAVTQGLFPAWVEYEATRPEKCSGKTLLRKRLSEEQKGAIIATNPPLACGFLANHVLLHLLERGDAIHYPRRISHMPEMPGYLYIDAATMHTRIVNGKWW